MKSAKRATLSAWHAHATLRTLTLAGLFMVVLTWLSSTAVWQGIELKGFDLLTVLSAPKEFTKPILLVGIDDESFSNLKQRWPWPFGIHGRLIDALKGAGATVIAFDVIFAFSADKKEDEALAGAINRAGNVVLASRMVRSWETKLGTAEEFHNPLPVFTESGAAVGRANILFDIDSVLRHIPGDKDAFWREIVAKLKATSSVVNYDTSVKPEAMIRYVGPAKTFPRISYYKALDLKPGELFNKPLVIVGRDSLAAADINSTQVDTFTTPFGGELMAGMEIHANILESVLNGQTINPAPKWASNTLLFITMLLAALLMRRFRPAVSALTGAVLLAALAWTLFVQANIWLPVGISILGIALLYVTQAILALVARKRKLKEDIHKMVGELMNEPATDSERPTLTSEGNLTPIKVVTTPINNAHEEVMNDPIAPPAWPTLFDQDKSPAAKAVAKAENQAKPLKIFISYSHRQHDYYPLFKSEFIDFANFPGLSIEITGDDELPLGSIWHDFLQEKVALCDAMVLLVSQAFLNSQYIREHEFGEAINRLKKGKNICIIPVYFAPCNFESEGELARLQFFKPRGDDYGCRDILDFSYTDLVDRRDGKVVKNSTPNRDRYMKTLLNKMERELRKLANATSAR